MTAIATTIATGTATVTAKAIGTPIATVTTIKTATAIATAIATMTPPMTVAAIATEMVTAIMVIAKYILVIINVVNTRELLNSVCYGAFRFR